ncbi:MAG: UDP-glucose 4-epimerase GalE [Gammaproteobacteria bacterium]
MKKNKLLVTGVAGYIGSTFTYEALKKGHEVVGVDNFCNSDDAIVNNFLRNYADQFEFIELDLQNKAELNSVLRQHKNIDCVLHFAALKSVPESEEKFDLYWKNNVEGTKILLEAIEIHGIKNIIFSSSAAIYGEQEIQPINEEAQTKPVSNYALTKLESEKHIKNYASNGIINAISLRYFNPVASHEDYVIHEDYTKSNNLMSVILQAANKKIDVLKIYGNDYPTKDGTAERDFIHISDLIDGHFCALDKIGKLENYTEINLGTGVSISVLDMVQTFKKVNKIEFQVEFASRRKGDVSINYAEVDKARDVLGWQSSHNLEKMCKDAWEAVQK